jgi:hypothetical protein
VLSYFEKHRNIRIRKIVYFNKKFKTTNSLFLVFRLIDKKESKSK